MHLLRSTAIGTEVIDEAEHRIQGRVSDLLFDPDRGTIVAFFVQSPFTGTSLILQTHDILSWGQRLHIREQEVLGEVEDIIRLRPLLEEKRVIIFQHIKTKSGTMLGKCHDIQFNTKTFVIEWIFPRKWLRRGAALPASDILEVTEEAIIVRDQGPRAAEERAEEPADDAGVEAAVSPAAGRSIER